VTATVVALQFGDACPVAHNFVVFATIVTPAASPVVSLVNTDFVCAVLNGPLDVSFIGAGGEGAVTVGVYVVVAICPSASATT
jgi:hypothetical protein